MSKGVETPGDLAGAAYADALRKKAAELKAELIRQTLEDAKSWKDAVDKEWAEAHPGEWDGYPIPEAEVEGYRNAVRNEYYEWVVPAFERYLTPDPDANNGIIDTLYSLEGTFAGSLDGNGNYTPADAALVRINDVRSEMSHWEGDLTTNFIDNFATPLQNVSINQGAVAKGVREQLECVKILYIRRRKGILKLAEESVEAVKTLKNGRDPKEYTWGTLVGISFGTALTLASGGVAVAGGAMIITSTLAQGVAPSAPPTNRLSAATAQEVAANITKAMNQMDADTDREETRARTAFKNVTDTIADARGAAISANKAGPFSVARPALSEAGAADITDGSLRPRH